MALKKQKPRGKPFPKGKSGNPGGGRKANPLVKAFRQTTYEEFIFSLQKLGAMPQQAVDKLLSDPETPMFEKVFARIVDGAAAGDNYARTVLLERLWGKAREVDVGPGNDPLREQLRNFSVDELLALIKGKTQ